MKLLNTPCDQDELTKCNKQTHSCQYVCFENKQLHFYILLCLNRILTIVCNHLSECHCFFILDEKLNINMCIYRNSRVGYLKFGPCQKIGSVSS